jgi:hypothetical protein
MKFVKHNELVNDFEIAYRSFKKYVSQAFADKFAKQYSTVYNQVGTCPTLSIKLSAHHYFWQYDSISEIRIKPIGFPYDHSLYNVIDDQTCTNYILALLSDRQDYYETVSSLEYREQTKEVA